MHPPPKQLDGANVHAWALADAGHPLGFDDHHGKRRAIVALAIAWYDTGSEQQSYLFECDANWRVLGDTLHSSVEAAKAEAENFWGVARNKWQERAAIADR